MRLRTWLALLRPHAAPLAAGLLPAGLLLGIGRALPGIAVSDLEGCP